jgi:hypothetical protein
MRAPSRNPNEDWFTGRHAEHPDGEDLPIAVTAGMFAVPIARTQAIRWLENEEWGADWKVAAAPKTHVLGRTDVEQLRVAELGSHSSHYSKEGWGDKAYVAATTAGRLASYAVAKLDDQHIVNDPVIRAFHQSSASRTAQKLQVSRLSREDRLLYPPERAPKDVRDYYYAMHLAHQIIQQAEICEEKGEKSVVKLTKNIQVGDNVMNQWGDVPPETDFCISGPYSLIPDEPLRSYFGWYPELLGPVEASFTRGRAEEPRGLKEKAARDVWYVLDRMMTNILRGNGARIPEKGRRRNRGCYVDTRGWALIDIILEWINAMRTRLQHVGCVELLVKRRQPGAITPLATRVRYQRGVGGTGMLASKM